MLVDHRTYRCRPGTLPKQLELYEKAGGFEAQKRHLGDPYIYLYAESGALNTYVHGWLYEDAADRMRKRAALAADPAWQKYLNIVNEAGYIMHQDNMLMLPAPFAPIKAR